MGCPPEFDLRTRLLQLAGSFFSHDRLRRHVACPGTSLFYTVMIVGPFLFSRHACSRRSSVKEIVIPSPSLLALQELVERELYHHLRGQLRVAGFAGDRSASRTVRRTGRDDDR